MKQWTPHTGTDDDGYTRARQRMVQVIRRIADEPFAAPVSDEVLAVMARVPRHSFIPAGMREGDAYGDYPLPIGHGQTISQPYIVALMSSLLELDRHCRVLEIGTGCGYQTAVLAELAGAVYSLEIVAPLAAQAAQVLRELGYPNVETRAGDGHDGWPEQAPFDAIIVTAAASQVPQAMTQQLKPGGRMVIPLDSLYEQELVLIRKDADGALNQRNILPVRFVPLTGGRG